MLELQKEFNGIDIAFMKIYFDTVKQKYKHRFHCNDCKEPLYCVCYDSLEEAVNDNDQGMWCDRCTLKDAMLEDDDMVLDVLELIAESDDPERLDQIFDFISGLLTEKERTDALSELRAAYGYDECIGEVCKD